MKKNKRPVTPAIRQLKQAKVIFKPHLYAYEEHGGTEVSARELDFDEHAVIKTLAMEDNQGRPLIVLMHGDREVSTKELARILGVKTIQPCAPDTVTRHTGYQVGGTSPFGTRKSLPVYMEHSILTLSNILVNGGKRGLLVEISPQDVVKLLEPVLVDVAIEK